MDETTIGGLIAACIVLIGSLTAYIQQRTKNESAESKSSPVTEKSNGFSITSGNDTKVGGDVTAGNKTESYGSK